MTYTYFRRGKCLYWSTDPNAVSAAHRRAETVEQSQGLDAPGPIQSTITHPTRLTEQPAQAWQLNLLQS